MDLVVVVVVVDLVVVVVVEVVVVCNGVVDVVSSDSVMGSICLMLGEKGDWEPANFVRVPRLVNTLSRSRRNNKLGLAINSLELTHKNISHIFTTYLKYPCDSHHSIVAEG